ncbi:MAG TPA: methyltransferase domain-containing protein [Flavisolibacter sp.]
MNEPQSYVDINRKLWEERTPHHIRSDFYDMEAFLRGKNSLNDIELELLGDVAGKSILHLQCHFGQDTLSLARMGASVTGVDFSEKAIEKARQLAEDLHLPATFVCCNVYDVPMHLQGTYDIVFTSYGTIAWLPDLDRWAAVIAGCLEPGGFFVFAEFHPAMWMFDNDFSGIRYSYFNRGPIVEQEEGTYADTGAVIKTESTTWNHSIGEVHGALTAAGLQVVILKEFDYSPHQLPHMEPAGPGRYHITGFGGKLPLVYSLKAVKQ